MSGRPARRGTESSGSSALARPQPSRRSERRRNASCGFTEITLLVVACILAGALFRLVPHSSMHSVARELGPLSEGGLTAATPTRTSLPSHTFEGLSDSQLAELVVTQNTTLSKLTQIVHALKSNPGVDFGSDSASLPSRSGTEDGTRVASVGASATLAANTDRSQIQSQPFMNRISSSSISHRAAFRHPKGPSRAEEPQLPSPESLAGSPRVVHGINLVPPTHGLHADQDLTLSSMRLAMETASSAGTADVTVLAIEGTNDLDYPLPKTRGSTNRFRRAKAINRTVLDSPASALYLNSSTPRRPLPLLTDLLQILYENSEGADWLMFTNADIGLQPDFYAAALRLAHKRNAIAINRVEVPDEVGGKKLGAADLDQILALGKSKPQKHHGFDCFVWRRELTPILRLAVGNLCVGYPPLGNVFVDALGCAAEKFQVMKGEHLTFHLGIKNGGWGLHRDEYEGYNRLSRKMGEATLVSLATQLGSRSHQSCVNAHLSQQGVDGGGTLSAATTGEAPTAAAAACARQGVNTNLLLQDHATGMGALKQHQKKPYKRIKDVHRECQALRSHLPFVGAAADELSRVTAARGAEMKAARDAAEAAHFEEESGADGHLAANKTTR